MFPSEMEGLLTLEETATHLAFVLIEFPEVMSWSFFWLGT